MILGSDAYFWIAVIGAATLKVALSPFTKILPTLVTFFAAIFIAFTFTDPVLAYLNLDPAVYRNGAAAIVGITGEGVVRWLLRTASEPGSVIELIKAWRGGGK